MEYTDEFFFFFGSIVIKALENSGADMSQIYCQSGYESPDENVFKNISGQYAEVKTKTKKGGKNG